MDASWEWAEDSERRRFYREMRNQEIFDDSFISWMWSMEIWYRSDPNFKQMPNGSQITNERK